MRASRHPLNPSTSGRRSSVSSLRIRRTSRRSESSSSRTRFIGSMARGGSMKSVRLLADSSCTRPPTCDRPSRRIGTQYLPERIVIEASATRKRSGSAPAKRSSRATSVLRSERIRRRSLARAGEAPSATSPAPSRERSSRSSTSVIFTSRSASSPTWPNASERLRISPLARREERSRVAMPASASSSSTDPSVSRRLSAARTSGTGGGAQPGVRRRKVTMSSVAASARVAPSRSRCGRSALTRSAPSGLVARRATSSRIRGNSISLRA